MLSFPKIPSVSIIAPAYNEEKTIIENIKCLLSVQYIDYDIIIVNDGSKDNTLDQIVDYFGLIKVNKAFIKQIECASIRGIYQSENKAYSNLIVIDKENGGKSDALNAGINLSQKDLFLAIDVDCIIESDAILKMVKPFVDDSEHITIASGGVIRIANSCEVTDGKITKVNYPDNFWAKFQVLEYCRAFTLGRMAWSKLNGLLIISGAFGLFDRRRVLNVGGYDITTVGEDLELVVRLRKYMHEIEKKKYRVAFIPDPLCWTEVPESYKVLSRQRNRWTRGAIDTIKKHKNMFFNKKYGIIGIASYPYWVFYEWLTPIIEFLGFIYLFFFILCGGISWQIAIIVLLFVITFSTLFSSIAIFIEAYTYNKYRGNSYLLKSFLFIFLEMFIYQPANMFFSLSGNFDYFFRKNNKGWGNMTRKGFTLNKEKK
jgi:Glycosyltransferases, probably involved in cell wall biogenesis